MIMFHSQRLITWQACKLQVRWKVKFKSCPIGSFQNEFSELTKCLPPVDIQSKLWICPSINAAIGNTKMSLQKSFQESFLTGKTKGKLAIKRKPPKVGWLLAGCCFSKKSRKGSVGKDICTETENRPDTSYSDSSETQVLCPAERTIEVSVKDTDISSPVQVTISNEEVKPVLDFLLKEEETPILKDLPTKGDKETVVNTEDDCVRIKDVKEKPVKPRPNYFVAVQVDNPQIHESLQCVQDSLLENNPLMKKALISLSTLHITFIVMHIEEEKDLERAKEALVASYEKIKEYLKDTPLVLTFEGLSNFRKQVLFAELKMNESHRKILTLYDEIVSCFELHGFDVKEKNNFTPHLTVAKLSKDPKLRRKGLKQILPVWYEDFEDNVFGEQVVQSLQLLKMARRDDGYYPCAKECFFESPSTKVPVPLEKRLSASLEKKKEIRKKVRDLTSEKLGLLEQS